jgi:hypothetical protein
MKSEQQIFTEPIGWSFANGSPSLPDAGLVLLFGHVKLLLRDDLLAEVKSRYPQALITGCSTSVSISGDEAKEESLICTAVQFEHTGVKAFSLPIESAEQSFPLGQQLGGMLDAPDLIHLLVFSDGLTVNGSKLTKGLNSHLGNRVTVSGGLASNLNNSGGTLVVHNGKGRNNLILAVGFYGTHLKVGCGSRGGWESFGIDRQVTRSEGNILYELDGQPALSLYKKYLGPHAADLPASAMLFPLSFISKQANVPIVRTILSVNETDGSMIFAGDIPVGKTVRLMKASFEKLCDGAAEAAEFAREDLGPGDIDLALLISCVGRKMVMKQRVELELESVHFVLENAACTTGFYANGEICPVEMFNHQCELLNQTMTVTLFREI